LHLAITQQSTEPSIEHSERKASIQSTPRNEIESRKETHSINEQGHMETKDSSGAWKWKWMVIKGECNGNEGAGKGHGWMDGEREGEGWWFKETFLACVRPIPVQRLVACSALLVGEESLLITSIDTSSTETTP
jgi:hypothetical protein